MNSNLLLLLLTLLVGSCGVKGDPIAPRSSVTPSVIDNYEDIELPQKLNEHKKR